MGIFEFFDRISLLSSVLAAAEFSQTWQQLYLSDEHFAHNIRQCLVLNNIDPDWVTLDQVGILLFPHKNELSEWQEGLLIQINTPVTAPKGNAISFQGEIIGAIATHTALDKAIELAETVPLKEMQAIMKGKNDLEYRSTEEGKKKEQMKRDRARAKAQIEAMRQKAMV